MPRYSRRPSLLLEPMARVTLNHLPPQPSLRISFLYSTSFVLVGRQLTQRFLLHSPLQLPPPTTPSRFLRILQLAAPSITGITAPAVAPLWGPEVVPRGQEVPLVIAAAARDAIPMGEMMREAETQMNALANFERQIEQDRITAELLHEIGQEQ